MKNVFLELPYIMKKNVTLLLCCTLIASAACNKEGVGGKADIIGVVKRQGTPIPNAVVYIKYGATDFPGFNTSEYNDYVTAASTDASFKFENLYKGDYYLWARGFDNSISQDVSGGITVQIKKKKETVETNIPVKE